MTAQGRGYHRCSGCGTNLYPEDVFCPSCGTGPAASAAVAPPPARTSWPAGAIAAGILGVGLVLAACVYGGISAGWVPVGRISGGDMAATLEQRLSHQFGVPVQAKCEDVLKQKGRISDCQVTAAGDSTGVRITQDDTRGHFHFDVEEPRVLLRPAAPTPSPVAPTTAAYPVAVQVAFEEACTAASHRPDACGCAITTIERRYTLAQFEALDAEAAHGTYPPELTAVIEACS